MKLSVSKRIFCSLITVSTLASTPVTAFAKNVQSSDLPSSVAPTEAVMQSIRVRRALAERRKVNIERFKAYRLAGVFPQNVTAGSVVPVYRNVFVDSRGVACAVANLIRQSGDAALVTKAAKENNFVRLSEVKTGPLLDWILTSGLTQEEIAMIQAPYMPMPQENAHAFEQMERARLQAHFTVVESQLIAATEKSLDTATSRYAPALESQLFGRRYYGNPEPNYRSN